jgi:hypothetical protein
MKFIIPIIQSEKWWPTNLSERPQELRVFKRPGRKRHNGAKMNVEHHSFYPGLPKKVYLL